MSNLKIIFAGTPLFAATHFQALLDRHCLIQAVLTQPDRPAGRGKHLQQSPVKQIALKHDLPIYSPTTLCDEVLQDALQEFNADVMVVVAYGLILPEAVLSMPRLGCVNVHASLLPKYRGASPIQQAILSGDAETGITVMKIIKALDAGPMLLQSRCAIEKTDTAETLSKKLAQLGAETLLKTLDRGLVNAEAQDETQATYTKKIDKSDARIDWNKSAIDLDREIRAFNPWPISFTEMNGERIRIWQATPLAETHHKKPGQIISANPVGIGVATGEGVLQIQQLQLSGGKKLPVSAVLNGKPALFQIDRRFDL
ncbi:MAG: methionyl-tRNA formyltransferase [Pseudomonadota bacterium]